MLEAFVLCGDNIFYKMHCIRKFSVLLCTYQPFGVMVALNGPPGSTISE